MNPKRSIRLAGLVALVAFTQTAQSAVDPSVGLAPPVEIDGRAKHVWRTDAQGRAVSVAPMSAAEKAQRGVAQRSGLSTADLASGLTPEDLVTTLLGSGISASNVTYTGSNVAAGTFSGGTGIIGFESGIVLSSGNIASVVGPNVSDSVTTDNGQPGDPQLTQLVPGYSTFDATILEFDFDAGTSGVIQMQYVFSSDEYNEWAYSSYNDVFGLFLNGTNIAFVPGTPSTPVAINNVNCTSTYTPPDGTNCGYYRNNDLSNGGGSIDTEMDGLTTVFTATAAVPPGTNHMKIAIADSGDHIYDSNVFLIASGFSPDPPTGACCDSATLTCVDDVLQGDCAGLFETWHVGIPCALLDPPCGGEPKWEQPLDTNAFSSFPECFWGWDEPSMYGTSGGQLAADDWLCSDSRPITAIQWWGSYTGWDEVNPPPGAIHKFHIGIWTDVPAGGGEPFSHPDTLIHEWVVSSSQFSEQWEGCDFHPEAMGAPETCYRYRFEIPQEDWFHQPGGPTVYWLSVAAIHDCPCLVDINGDGFVNVMDVGIVTSGPCYGQPATACPGADVNCDGIINDGDTDAITHPACFLQTNPANSICCGDAPDSPYVWGWTTREHQFNDAAVRIFDPLMPNIISNGVYLVGEPILDGGAAPWDLAFLLLTNTSGLQACCLGDGSCVAASPADCINVEGGNPQGGGTVCTAPEACCFPDESCLMFDPLCCLDQGGWPQGSGSDCGSPCPPWEDCNSNGIPDAADIAGGTSADCNSNAVPDACDLAAGTSADCNGNTLPDDCELTGNDCNSDGILDVCQLAGNDCNSNAILDACDIAAGTSTDCNGNTVPDNCELTGNDCNTDGILDVCQLAGNDCNSNAILDVCDLAAGTSSDCNGNTLPDDCELAGNDCNSDGILDVCQLAGNDCNENLILDACDIASGFSKDCQGTGTPDACELAAGTSADINENDVPDDCEPCAAPLGTGDTDSNAFVDLNDYTVFHSCVSGPGSFVGGNCTPCDMDGDCDVDLADYERFQRAFGRSIYPTRLTPTDDTFIDRQRPSQVLGGGTQLQVRNNVGGSSGWEIDTLIRFGFSDIPVGTPIVSATMHIYYYAWVDRNPSGRTHRCRQLQAGWDESTATWNNRPAWSSVISAEATVPGSPNNWMSWDVTADAQAFIDGATTNYGWVLRDEQSYGSTGIPYTRSRSKEYGVNVPYLEIVYAPPTRGACCLPDGACIDVLDQDECATAGGVYAGALTDCASTACPQPEACCLPSGICVDLLVATCSATNGLPQGPGTDCAGTECPEACCLGDGGCADIGSNACIAQYGFPQGAGTNCVTAACAQPEACCLADGSCEDLAPAHCVSSNGTPGGLGTDCATTECPEACCLLDGGCVDVGSSACLAQSGAPQGMGSECTGVSCPQPEACCYPDGDCQDEPAAVCTPHGGVPQGAGTDCLTTQCPQPEACCDTNGNCVEELPSSCTASNGFPQGEGSDCLLAACDLPQACCYVDGSCLDDLPAVCAGGGNDPQGVGTDCLTIPPCPVVVLIDQVRSLADHNVGTFGLLIDDTSDIESRATGIHHLEVSFNLPMDAFTCEDPANLLITSNGPPEAVGVALDLDSSGTMLTIRLDSALDPRICWYFDLSGMLSAGLAPISDPVFEIVGLPGDVLRDGSVGPEDLAEYAAHQGEPVDETNFYIDVAPDGWIGLDDFSTISANLNASASCP